MKHTPGPWEWELESGMLVAAGDPLDDWAPEVEIILWPSNAISEPERAIELLGALGHSAELHAYGNALLIAAAPDLLAELEAVEWVPDNVHDAGYSYCPRCLGERDRGGHAPDCPRQLALAKARCPGALGAT